MSLCENGLNVITILYVDNTLGREQELSTVEILPHFQVTMNRTNVMDRTPTVNPVHSAWPAVWGKMMAGFHWLFFPVNTKIVKRTEL